MNRKDILNDVFEKLRYDKILSTKKEFAERIGFDKTNLSSAFNGAEKYLTDSLFNKIADAFPQFNSKWLQTGEGEMLKDNSSTTVKANNDMNGYRMVPVYNFDVVGGMHSWGEVVDSPTYIEKYVPFTGAAQGDICVHVTGNSMMPTYSSGSLLLIRKVEGWREYFGYGHCYVLLLKDGRRILKEVQKSEIDPIKYVLCVSHNPHNPPEELPRDFIVGVYKVIMTLTNEGY